MGFRLGWDTVLLYVDRGQRCTHKDRGTEACHCDDTEWREDAVPTDDCHPVCHAAAGPHDQEAAAHFLGGCAQVHS